MNNDRQSLGDLGIIDLTLRGPAARMSTPKFYVVMKYLPLLPLLGQSFASLVNEWYLIWTAHVTEFEARR